MKKHQKKIIKLTAEQALISVFNLTLPFFEASRIYRVGARKAREDLAYEDSNIRERISYLKKWGFIEDFVEGKERHFEITSKGIDRVKKIHERELTITRPDHWDGKWRLVIFDIPNEKKNKRDVFRKKLLRLEFEKVQESIYVYPFECAKEILTIIKSLGIDFEVLLLIADIIQGEENIIEKFLDKKILDRNDIN